MRNCSRFIVWIIIFSVIVSGSASGEETKAEKKLEIVKGPYLQWPMQNSVTVMWETSFEATSTVTYFQTQRIHFSARENGLFKTLGNTERKLEDKKFARIHELTLTGLDVDTTYNYKVMSKDKTGQSIESELFSLKTAVAKNTPFSFAVTSETLGKDPELVRQVFKQIERYRPEFLLLVGDTVRDGRIYEQWDKYLFGPGRNLFVNTPFYLCLGNHEECSPWFYNFVSYPKPENYYSFDYGNSHFVALDCTSDKNYKNYDHDTGTGPITPGELGKGFMPGSPQYKFLVDDLKNSKAAWKFVFFHYPPYVSGDYQVDQMRVLCPVFEKYGVDIVFTSHTKVYERSHPLTNNQIDMQNGVIYIVAGAAAAPGWFHSKRAWHTAQAIAVPHFVQVIIAQNTLQLNAIDNDGRVFDTLKLTK